jgi:hypothetical protein
MRKVQESNICGFEFSPFGTGRKGGVILTTTMANGEAVEVRYAYTDFVATSRQCILSRPPTGTSFDARSRLFLGTPQ